MNKIKLLILLLISPIAAFSANDGVSWPNKSPIENVSTFLTSIKNNFTVESNKSASYANFSIREAYYFNDYCTPTYTSGCSGGAKISNFEITDAIINLTNNTGTATCGANGYNDFTTMSASASAEMVVSYTVGVGSYSAGVKIWVDWNDNGEFETDELMGQSTATISSGSSFTGNFTVPTGTALGDYGVRVRAVESTTTFTACSSQSWGEAEDYTFTVIEAPACMPVSALAATPTSLTSVELSWTSDGDLFDVEWGPTGFTLGSGTLIEDIEETEVSVTTVIDTPYQFYVRRNCGADGYSLWAGPFSFETGYCTPTYTNGCSNGAKISNFEISDAIINLANNTGTATCGANGYNDFTTMSASAPAGMVVSTTVGVGSYSAGVKIWIDWNGNGEFETDELMAASTATISSGSSFTGNFTVPADTPLGDYRVRVRVVESTTTFTPCSNQSYGEVEDYTFTVIEEPACMPPSGLAATPTSLTSVDLSWTSSGDLFELEWGPTGFTLGSGTLIEDIEETEVSVTTVIDTPYQFYVRRNCGADGYSLWAGPFSFETGYCTPTYTNGCSNGAKISNFEISDAIINLANNTGTGSCGANGYNDFTTMSASAPAEMVVSTTVGVGSYSGGVKIWIDWNSNGEFETDELVAASTATVSSGSSFTGNFTVPADTPLGDYRVRVRVVEGSTNFTPCSNQSYGEVEDYTFTVIEEPACMPPSGLAATATSLTSVDLSWTSDGDLFELEWGPTGFTLGDGTLIEDIEETEVTVTTEIDTPYQFYVRRDCGADGYSLWAGPFSFETGYCLPVYTTGCSGGAKISNFEITDAIINLANNTGTATCGANGYNDFTTMSASAPAEMVVSFTVGIGSYSAGVKIWVDWNGNGEFEADELMAASTATIASGSSFTGNFTVPAGTALGDYRIRVRAVESTTNFTPCSSHSWGEAEDYTFTVIEEPSCMPPSGLTVLDVTEESIQVGWTENPDQTTWEVIALPAGSPAPNATTTGFETTTENPYIIDGLNPSTTYDVYIRTNCGQQDGVSLWVGPVTTTTTQIPADLDFEEDIEWTFTNEEQANKWVVGTAVSNGGTQSLYISNDEGVSNTYTTSSTTVTHAIRDIALPDDIDAMGIGFDWKAIGESSWDYLRVWVVSSTFQPQASQQITALAGERIQIAANFNQSADWQTYYQELNVADFAGQTVRIVFEWRNDGSGGTQPPAAVDNVNLTFVTCPAPTNINSSVTCELPPTATLTWTPGGSETQWEYLLLDPADPNPTATTTGTLVGEATVEIPNLTQGEDFVFWVRAKCGDDNLSNWVSHDFSSYGSPVAGAQPFCAEEGGGIIFPNTTDTGNMYGSLACLGTTPNPTWYYLTIDQPGDLDFQIIQNTMFDADGNAVGTGLDVDFIAWGPFVDMPQACEMIDLDNPTLYSIACSYSAAAIENFSINNAQAGEVYVLLITNYNNGAGFIKLHQTNEGAENGGSTDCSFLCDVTLPEDIVVCEGTEVILEADTFSFGGEGNQSNEITEIRWFRNGTLLDPTVYNELEITVTESGVYRIEVVKENCTEDFNSDEITVTFVSKFDGEITNSIELCDIANDLVEDFDIDAYLDILTNEIPSDFSYSLHENLQSANANTQPITGIYTSGEATLYLRVESIDLLGCYNTFPVNLILKEAPQPNNIPDSQLICNYYQLPQLLPNQRYTKYEVKNEFGAVIDEVTEVDPLAPLQPGFYEIYFETVTVEGCIAISSYDVTVIGCIIPKGISPNGDGDNDYLDLTYFMVQEIKIYNRYGKEVFSQGAGYKREWAGQDNNGNPLPTGTYYYNIITPLEHFTGYIYVVREVK
ncbi:MAG: GEVED domain-containing protein [Myroides sp.]|nr:GEVED domain-containing protein [Myroides sp.]